MLRQNDLPEQVAGSAAPESEEPPRLLNALQAAVAALSTAAAFEAGARVLFAGLGWSEIVVPILSAVGLLVASCYLAMSKVSARSPLSATLQRRQWRFSRPLRLIGKAGALAALGLVVHRLWDARPNFIAGESEISGFICAAGSGRPITSGTVEILSRSGRVMSEVELLDDRGFFYADLARSALLPTALRFAGSGCGKPDVILLEAHTHGVCLAAQEIVDLGPYKEWVVVCES